MEEWAGFDATMGVVGAGDGLPSPEPILKHEDAEIETFRVLER